jgi:hypothetical protein
VPLRNGENRVVARLSRALCRTRTGDPFLTIVFRARNGGTPAVTSDTK